MARVAFKVWGYTVRTMNVVAPGWSMKHTRNEYEQHVQNRHGFKQVLLHNQSLILGLRLQFLAGRLPHGLG